MTWESHSQYILAPFVLGVTVEVPQSYERDRHLRRDWKSTLVKQHSGRPEGRKPEQSRCKSLLATSLVALG